MILRILIVGGMGFYWICHSRMAFR